MVSNQLLYLYKSYVSVVGCMGFSQAPVVFVYELLKFSYRWYAKRFLHPDIVAPYDYIFMWDEDLGVENFNAEE